MLPTITTSRLRLRAIGAGDAADLFAVFSDPEVVRYWSRPALTEVAEATAMIERIERHADEGSLLQWDRSCAEGSPDRHLHARRYRSGASEGLDSLHSL